MPLRLCAHTERGSEKQREYHYKTDFQRTLSSDKVQDGGRSD